VLLEISIQLCDVTFIYEYLKEGGRGDIIIRIGKSSGTLIEALVRRKIRKIRKLSYFFLVLFLSK